VQGPEFNPSIAKTNKQKRFKILGILLTKPANCLRNNDRKVLDYKEQSFVGFLLFVCLFEIGSRYVAQAGIELAM
jgi:hypothetical protein